MIIRDPEKVDLCEMVIRVMWQVDDRISPTVLHGRIIYHDGQFNEPITLASIKKKHPKVDMVIAENGLEGKVYRYGNNKDENGKPLWEEVGKTQGYA